MSMTGIGISSDTLEKFNKQKMERSIKGLIFRIDEASGEVVVETETNDSFEELVQRFPINEPRFATYDFPFVNRAGLEDTRLLFIFWSPDDAPIKLKMLFAGTKNFFRSQLGTVMINIEGTALKDFSKDKIAKRIEERVGINR